MKENELMDLLLSGEEWFLNINEEGRAEISTTPFGVVVGKITCHRPSKNSNDALDTTARAPKPVSS